MSGAKAPPLIPTNCFVLRTPTLLSNILLSRNFHPRSIPIPCTKKAATHATKHCQSTTAMAHFPPSSLRTEAMAATQGVYSRLNTSNVAAANGVSTVAMLSPNNTSRVATTLSFAMNPLIREVQIRQSPNPSGRNTGTNRPDSIASILLAEFSTRFSFRSKLCKNHTTIVAMKITVNAFCKKSFAFSHNNCPTFLAPGRR